MTALPVDAGSTSSAALISRPARSTACTEASRITTGSWAGGAAWISMAVRSGLGVTTPGCQWGEQSGLRPPSLAVGMAYIPR